MKKMSNPFFEAKKPETEETAIKEENNPFFKSKTTLLQKSLQLSGRLPIQKRQPAAEVVDLTAATPPAAHDKTDDNPFNKTDGVPFIRKDDKPPLPSANLFTNTTSGTEMTVKPANLFGGFNEGPFAVPTESPISYSTDNQVPNNLFVANTNKENVFKKDKVLQNNPMPNNPFLSNITSDISSKVNQPTIDKFTKTNLFDKTNIQEENCSKEDSQQIPKNLFVGNKDNPFVAQNLQLHREQLSANDCCLLVENIPRKFYASEFLHDFYAKFGVIIRVQLQENNTAVVVFVNRESAEKAFELGRVIDENEPEMVLSIVAKPPNQAIFSPLKQQSLKQSSPVKQIKPQSVVTRSLSLEALNTTLQRLVVKLSMTQCPDVSAKYQVLDAIDKHIKEGVSTRKKRNEAIQGCCTDMCPEKERYQREERRQASYFELADDGTLDANKAVKEYSRSSADQEEPLPHELRPPGVLHLTMTYLVHCVITETMLAERSDWFDFVWNRTRAIRKDITQQNLKCTTSIDLIEKCARFHIFCGHELCEEELGVFDPTINLENLTKCLQTLKHMYQDLWNEKSLCSPNEAEFRCYQILLNLNNPDTLREVVNFREEVRRSAPVKFALQLFSTVQERNYVRFFKLLRSSTYLNACLIQPYFNQMREMALHTMTQAFANKTAYSLQKLNNLLCFNTTQELTDFCEHFGLVLNGDTNDSVVLSRVTLRTPEEYFPRSKSTIINQKRVVSLSEVINGGALPPPDAYHPTNSFSSDGYYIGNYHTFTSPAENNKKDEVETSEKPSLEEEVEIIEGREEVNFRMLTPFTQIEPVRDETDGNTLFNNKSDSITPRTLFGAPPPRPRSDLENLVTSKSLFEPPTIDLTGTPKAAPKISLFAPADSRSGGIFPNNPVSQNLFAPSGEKSVAENLFAPPTTDIIQVTSAQAVNPFAVPSQMTVRESNVGLQPAEDTIFAQKASVSSIIPPQLQTLTEAPFKSLISPTTDNLGLYKTISNNQPKLFQHNSEGNTDNNLFKMIPNNQSNLFQQPDPVLPKVNLFASPTSTCSISNFQAVSQQKRSIKDRLGPRKTHAEQKDSSRQDPEFVLTSDDREQEKRDKQLEEGGEDLPKQLMVLREDYKNFNTEFINSCVAENVKDLSKEVLEEFADYRKEAGSVCDRFIANYCIAEAPRIAEKVFKEAKSHQQQLDRELSEQEGKRIVEEIVNNSTREQLTEICGNIYREEGLRLDQSITSDVCAELTNSLIERAVHDDVTVAVREVIHASKQQRRLDLDALTKTFRRTKLRTYLNRWMREYKKVKYLKTTLQEFPPCAPVFVTPQQLLTRLQPRCSVAIVNESNSEESPITKFEKKLHEKREMFLRRLPIEETLQNKLHVPHWKLGLVTGETGDQGANNIHHFTVHDLMEKFRNIDANEVLPDLLFESNLVDNSNKTTQVFIEIVEETNAKYMSGVMYLVALTEENCDEQLRELKERLHRHCFSYHRPTVVVVVTHTDLKLTCERVEECLEIPAKNECKCVLITNKIADDNAIQQALTESLEWLADKQVCEIRTKKLMRFVQDYLSKFFFKAFKDHINSCEDTSTPYPTGNEITSFYNNTIDSLIKTIDFITEQAEIKKAKPTLLSLKLPSINLSGETFDDCYASLLEFVNKTSNGNADMLVLRLAALLNNTTATVYTVDSFPWCSALETCITFHLNVSYSTDRAFSALQLHYSAEKLRLQHSLHKSMQRSQSAAGRKLVKAVKRRFSRELAIQEDLQKTNTQLDQIEGTLRKRRSTELLSPRDDIMNESMELVNQLAQRKKQTLRKRLPLVSCTEDFLS